MVATDPDLKLVLVPYPILGPASVAASQIELALAQVATPQQYYAYHPKVYAQRGTITGLRAFQLARESGFDGRAIDTASESDEVAQTVLMVVANAYMTGQTVQVNGGLHFN